MAAEHRDFYEHLNISINYWLEQKGVDHPFAKHIKWAPELFKLACSLSLERSVILEDKGKLAVAVAYFISPFDLFPEALTGVIGYADDLVLLALVLKDTVNHTDSTLLSKYWKNDTDIKAIIDEILLDAEEMIGAYMFQKLRDLIDY